MFLLCESKARSFAIPVSSIKEVIPLPYLQDVPFNGKGYVGTLNYRGSLVPVFDASELLFGEPLQIDPANKVVIVDYMTDVYGFMVGDVKDTFEHDRVVSSGNGSEAGISYAVVGETFIPILKEEIIKKAIEEAGEKRTARFCPATKEAEEMFYERSKGLAGIVKSEEADEKEFLLAKLNDEYIAFEDIKVNEVVELGNITRVPGANEVFSGLFPLRGELIPIINLSKLLFDKEAKVNELSRIVVVQVEKEKIGLLVEELKDLIHIKTADIKPAYFLESVLINFCKGQFDFDDATVNILDVKKIIEEIMQKVGG